MAKRPARDDACTRNGGEKAAGFSCRGSSNGWYVIGRPSSKSCLGEKTVAGLGENGFWSGIKETQQGREG